jgi:hypothetical protein
METNKKSDKEEPRSAAKEAKPDEGMSYEERYDLDRRIGLALSDSPMAPGLAERLREAMEGYYEIPPPTLVEPKANWASGGVPAELSRNIEYQKNAGQPGKTLDDLRKAGVEAVKKQREVEKQLQQEAAQRQEKERQLQQKQQKEREHHEPVVAVR